MSIASALVEKSATVSKLSYTESIYGALDLVDLKLTAHTFNKCTLELSYGSSSILRNSKKKNRALPHIAQCQCYVTPDPGSAYPVQRGKQTHLWPWQCYQDTSCFFFCFEVQRVTPTVSRKDIAFLCEDVVQTF